MVYDMDSVVVQSDVRILAWLSVVIARSLTDPQGVEGRPVYLKRSSPVSHNIWSAQFKGPAGPNII